MKGCLAARGQIIKNKEQIIKKVSATHILNDLSVASRHLSLKGEAADTEAIYWYVVGRGLGAAVANLPKTERL